MGYKNPDKQRAFQTEWLKRRRREWVDANGPCQFVERGRRCNSTEDLRIVSLSEAARLKTVHVFGLSDAKRLPILAGCAVYCLKHHRERHATRMRKIFKEKPPYLGNVLSSEAVWAIRGRLLGRESLRSIARAFDISHHQVLAIQTGRAWRLLKGGRRKVYGIRKTKELI